VWRDPSPILRVAPAALVTEDPIATVLQIEPAAVAQPTLARALYTWVNL
jgi:hypothetical protein